MSNNKTRSDLRISMREEEARPQTHWSPPAVLDAPKARPGYVQRWVYKDGWLPRFWVKKHLTTYTNVCEKVGNQGSLIQ